MPRVKNRLGSYNNGWVIEYEVTDTTSWVQMVRDTMVRCDDDARRGGRGLVRRFNISTGRGSSYIGKLPEDTAESNWIKNERVKTYIMEKDVS